MSLHILSLLSITLIVFGPFAHSSEPAQDKNIDGQYKDTRYKGVANDNNPPADKIPESDDDRKPSDDISKPSQERPGYEAKVQCRNAVQTAAASCRQSVGDSSGGSDATTIGGAAAAMSDAYEATGKEALRVSQACLQAAETCKSTCTSLAQNHPDVQDSLYTFRHACHRMQSGVPRKYKEVREKLEEAKREVDEIAERAGYDNDYSRPKSSGYDYTPSSLPASLPAENPYAMLNQNPQTPAPNAEKTPEQARPEKKEQTPEQRMEEALSKTFEQLNRQGEKNQAIVETKMPARENAAYSAMGSQNEKKAENEEKAARAASAAGHAGWIQEAKRRAALKNSGSNGTMAVTAASGPVRMAAPSRASGSAGGTQFSGSGFEAMKNGAALEAQAVAAKVSDLPDLKIETPSGGGGGNSSGAGGARKSGSKANLADYLPNGARYSNRGPAGLNQPGQIRTPSVDIWQIISIRFRSRCAEGRLMDCAGHLPK